MTLITLGLAWLAGIALAGWLEPPLPTLGLLALPPLAALFLWRREPGPRLAAACALALLAGGVRLLGATPHFGPGDLATYNDQGQVTLVGVVVDEPDVRDTYQNLRLRAESLTLESVGAGLAPAPTNGAGARPAPTQPAPTNGAGARPAPTQPAPTDRAGARPAPTQPAPTDRAGARPAPTQPAPTSRAGAGPAPTDSESAPDTRPVRGLVLVQAPRYPAHAYGERLAVSGELETPPVFEDFSYKDYLARQGVYSMLRRPRIELIEAGQGNPLWAALYAFKARGQGTIAQILPEPYAALLSGILLGVETGIPQNLYEQFNTTGTSHIIVISGFNIAIVAGLLMLAGSKAVGKRRAVPLALAGIVLYTLLVGADAAVMRAAIMGCLYVLALYFGRQTEVRTSLVFSALLMTAINPHTLWDVGFQLSFAATAGLIWVTPPLKRVVERWLTALVGAHTGRRVMGLLSEALLVTLAAQIATEPLIVYHFGRMSAVSLLTNLLILPVQPMVMLAGGLATMAGMVWLPLGQLLGWLAWLPLAWTVWVVGWTATVPFASLSLGRFSPWLLAAIYAGLVGGLWLASRSRSEAEAPPPPSPSPNRLRGSTRAMFAGGAVAVALIWLAATSLPDGRLHVAFLDVGQGDAVFITTPSGRQILIDGGPGPSDVLWGMGRHMPFWDRSLDVVVNTHPDADHLAGLPEVLGRYQVRQILLPDVENDTPLYTAWQEAMAAEGASVTQAQAGMRLSLEDGVQIEVLHPGAVPASDRFNDHSVVLRVTLGEISFLLPGDIEAGVEQGLVTHSPALAATVLKAPHHGGDTSNSQAFLEAVDPQVAVISVGADNRFGHPSPEVLARYAEQGVPALRTDELGTVEFVTDGERLWVEAGWNTTPN